MSAETAAASIVITTYNRRDLVPGAIESALEWIAHAGAGEVVVVDDASTDGTAEWIEAHYRDAIAAETLGLVALPHNRGVGGAKNAGVARAKGAWVIFLDSDDRLIPGSAPTVAAAIADAGGPILFFRTVDLASGAPIGAPADSPVEVDAQGMLAGWPFGDCVPAVRARVMRDWTFIEPLRGFEGLTWLRIMRHVGPIQVLPIAAIRVRTSGDDRISAASLRASGCRAARGTWMLFREFRDVMTLRRQLRCLITVCRSALWCVGRRPAGRERRGP